MTHPELLVPGLMVAVAALSVLADALRVPYPILLVLGGLVIGFLPGIPEVQLDPRLVLFLFLPPLLYVAAFFSSPRDLRRDARAISMLSVGLVLVTVVVVAAVAHALVPGLPWAAAFTLGAVVSPTDPLAATTIINRLHAPRRLATIVEGESLVNDGTALVVYRFAVAAAVGSGFSWAGAGLWFVVAPLGGIAIGLVVGRLVFELRRRLENPPVEITISLVTGYAAFIPAEELGLSGVLAAVTAGIYLGWRAPDLMSPRTRMQGFAVWEILQFLVNAVLFVLVGLQLQVVLDGLTGHSALALVGYAAAVCGAVVGARIAWQFTTPYLVRALDRRPSQVARRTGPKERFLVAWSGMRGGVSLAAALAIPFSTHSGAPFPNRDLIVFLTFAVILVTLVLQGLTLPLLIRRFRLPVDDTEDREELRARLAAVKAALGRLEELSREDWTRDDTVDRLRRAYDYRKRRFAARAGKVEDDGYEERSLAYQRLVRELLDVQRRALVDLRNQGEISDSVLRRVERDLDLEDTRLEI
jgi:monovalent cation/hydrogen antiporter